MKADYHFPGELEIHILVKKGANHHVIARGVDYNFVAQGPDEDTAIQCLIGCAIAQAVADEEKGRPIWSTRWLDRKDLRDAFANAKNQYVVKMQQPFEASDKELTRIPSIKAEFAFDRLAASL